ncbi:hypothetical protein [Paenibacillus sp. FSL H3-0333]|uniref:hypothetical protein n=1 Tax=Paenibacillus sp. FSL H3-0333 TaxID=2921373 RepID=UPI0030F90D5D
MNKVTVTKEQQETLQFLTKVYSAEDIVKKHALKKNFWDNTLWSEPINIECLNTLSVDEIVRALYIGIEIQKTPHERLRDCYEGYLDHGHSHYSFNADEKHGFRLGIAVTCFVLGEKIVGITE